MNGTEGTALDSLTDPQSISDYPSHQRGQQQSQITAATQCPHFCNSKNISDQNSNFLSN